MNFQKNRWLTLLFVLLSVLIFALSWYLLAFAKATQATSLIINILKPLNILLFLVLSYILFRHVFVLIMSRQKQRLRVKMVAGILPLTLIPSFFLFILATRFLDDMVLDLVHDPYQTAIIEHTNDLREDFLTEIGQLNRSHAPTFFKVFKQGEISKVQSMLKDRGLYGVEYYESNEMKARIFSESISRHKLSLVEQTATLTPEIEPRIFSDGFLIARFPATKGKQTLHFLYIKDTPFSERFSYIRDTHTYLKYSKRKNERVKGLNRGILLIATLAVIFGGLWTAMAFSRQFLGAFNELRKGAERISQGDFRPLDLKTGDELDDVVMSFNAMSHTLAANRSELEHKAKDLSELNTRLSEEIKYSQTILQEIGNGILSTDTNGLLQTLNPEALRILELPNEPISQPFEMILHEERHKPLQTMWEDFKLKGRPLSRQLEIQGKKVTRYVACSMVSLQEGGTNSGSLIVLDDLTQLYNAQKVAAWQEVAKRVAHEIKNPLTPIQLSIQRIKRKSDKGAQDITKVVNSAHDTIMSEIRLLKNLVDEFSTFAKMPAPVKTNMNFAAFVQSFVESYKNIYPNLELLSKIPEKEVPFSCDSDQLRQVINNLTQNASNAAQGACQVTLELQDHEENIILSVIDTGPGIPESERSKVFVPYYSKSPKGTGLGLAIVKRIVEDHGGKIEVLGNEPQGAIFQMTFTKI